MRTTLIVHVVAGCLGLLAGYVALYSTKGATLHRRSGRLFVYAMLPMAVFGMALAIGLNKAPAINIPAGLLTSYLVVTSLTTVRPLAAGARWLHLGGVLVALAVGATMLAWGFEAVASGGTRKGMPAFPFFMFGVVGALGAAGDVRMMWAGPPRGGARLARHLWRMSFALFIAALSFSVQAARMLPTSARVPALIALPMLAVLATMFYWLWRVRGRRAARGVVRVGAPEAA
jgi:uncharacterized membrane protein